MPPWLIRSRRMLLTDDEESLSRILDLKALTYATTDASISGVNFAEPSYLEPWKRESLYVPQTAINLHEVVNRRLCKGRIRPQRLRRGHLDNFVESRHFCMRAVAASGCEQKRADEERITSNRRRLFNLGSSKLTPSLIESSCANSILGQENHSIICQPYFPGRYKQYSIHQ